MKENREIISREKERIKAVRNRQRTGAFRQKPAKEREKGE